MWLNTSWESKCGKNTRIYWKLCKSTRKLIVIQSEIDCSIDKGGLTTIEDPRSSFAQSVFSDDFKFNQILPEPSEFIKVDHNVAVKKYWA